MVIQKRIITSLVLLFAAIMLYVCAYAEEYPESAHPYVNNEDTTWTYTHPEESFALKLTFSDATEFMYGDYLYITGEDGIQQSCSGPEIQGKSVVVAGNSCTLRLVSNGIYTAYGFSIVEITSMTKEEYRPDNRFSIDFSGEIKKYTGTDTDLIIPEIINGVKVASIGYSAFSGCNTLNSIVIPDEVTYIDHSAFADCTNLSSITIPEGVTDMGGDVFKNCSSLESITVPDGIPVLRSGLFANCSNLKSITVPDGVTILMESAFSNCTNLSSVELPEGLTRIDNSVFSGCTSLTSIDLPDGVTSIGNNVFSNCSNLNNVKLPNQLTSIGEFAFYACTSLSHIELPDTVTTIKSCAFYGCSALTGIALPQSVTVLEMFTFSDCVNLQNIWFADGLKRIDGSVFYNCKNLENVHVNSIEGWLSIEFLDSSGNPMYFASNLYVGNDLVKDVVIPDGITIIHESAFMNCSSLNSVVISESVTSIGKDAFKNCVGLNSIALSDTVTSIEADAFINCQNLENVYVDSIKGWLEIEFLNSGSNPMNYADNLYVDGKSIKDVVVPSEITSINESAFKNCRDLTRVQLPVGLKDIGDYAFSGCSSLTSIVIPDSVTHIGDSAFSSCKSLKHIELPESMTVIGNSVFSACDSLTDLEFLEGITTIGNSAFANCVGFTDIKLPDSITTIGESVFIGCSNLTDIEMSDGLTCISNMMFIYCKKLTGVKLPEQLTSIGDHAFMGCESLVSIELPESVTSMGDYVFYNCLSLKNVSLPQYLTDVGTNTFENCKSLSTIALPARLMSVPPYMFANCISLDNIRMPNAATRVGTYSFSNCSSLRSIVVPDYVTIIESSAFSGCSSLTSIALSDAITLFGDDVFSGCSKLERVYLLGDQAPCDDFTDCFGKNSVTIYCYESSAADSWAKNKGYKRVQLKYNMVEYLVLPDAMQLSPNEECAISTYSFPLRDFEYGIKWKSSDPEVASVEDGVVKALSVGATTITASCGDISSSMIVTVYAPIESFDLSASEIWIAAGEAAPIELKNVIPAGAVGYTLIISSSDSAVAAIDDSSIAGITPGDAVVTVATENGVERKCTVHVCNPVTAIEFETDAFTLFAGDTVQLSAHVSTGDANFVNRLVTFTSSDEMVASVDAYGLVTAVGNGSAVISAVSASGISASCSVSSHILVTLALPNSVEVIGEEAFMGVDVEKIILPDVCKVIGVRAFADMANLLFVYMPDSVTTIADNAFEGSGSVAFICPSANTAAAYAEAHGIPCTVK